MPSNSIGEAESRDGMLKLLEQQTELLLKVVLPLSRSEGETRAERFCVLPIAGCETVLSICDLARKARLGDCLMLSRSVVEWAVNYCFLLVSNDADATAFEQHAKQRQFRNLDRTVKSGPITVSSSFEPLPDPATVPDLQEALDAFTSGRGREITRWTKLHLHDRIRVFSERSNLDAIPLLSLAFWCYDDASEILHGTLYGSWASQGVHLPFPEAVDQIADGRNSTLFFMAIVLMNVLNLVVQATAEAIDLEPYGVAELVEFSAFKNSGIVSDLHDYMETKEIPSRPRVTFSRGNL